VRYSAIRAPALDDAALSQTIDVLRADGEIVVQALEADASIEAEGVDRELRLVQGRWQVVALDGK
jgi:hypothetical protein